MLAPLLSLLAAFTPNTQITLQDIKTWACQESILTTMFRDKKEFEWALDHGCRPTKSGLALVIMTSPEDTQLIKRIIEDYDIIPDYIDEEGNNLLGLLPIHHHTTATILYLLGCGVNPYHKNNADISFYDKCARSRYSNFKEEVITFIHERFGLPEINS